MSAFLLMRHGLPDYSHREKWETTGWGIDLGPLTEAGEEGVFAQLEAIRAWAPTLILSSPTTRTMHTGALLHGALGTPFKVEFDLHEWVPDNQFTWSSYEEVRRYQEDFERHGGEWPAGETKRWEPMSAVRARCLAVLNRYQQYARVLVVCHALVIQSLTGNVHTDYAGLVPFNLG